MSNANTVPFNLSKLTTKQKADLAQQAANEVKADQLKARALERKQKPLEYKVSEKGAISLYTGGRFPITSYAGDLLKILDTATDLRQFVALNFGTLAFQTEDQVLDVRDRLAKSGIYLDDALVQKRIQALLVG